MYFQAIAHDTWQKAVTLTLRIPKKLKWLEKTTKDQEVKQKLGDFSKIPCFFGCNRLLLTKSIRAFRHFETKLVNDLHRCCQPFQMLGTFNSIVQSYQIIDNFFDNLISLPQRRVGMNLIMVSSQMIQQSSQWQWKATKPEFIPTTHISIVNTQAFG